MNILDTTLRDGSYSVNFSFSTNDTAIICKKLEEAGFEYIEIGHGVGLSASPTYGQALHTDEEYMEAANRVLSKAKYGMFCIPGISNLDDIDKAAKFNMGFIRIGTNVTEVEQGKSFIESAKNKGIFVAANFMKSYGLKPKEFAKKVKQAENYGADLVYVVDSSGGMLPQDIKNYYESIREQSNVKLGFHGHNNLSLAVANSLMAIEVGYDFIDTSLQGLGRSSGNAITEILIAILLKMNIKTGIDFLKTLEIGNKYINPLISRKGDHPLDIVSGLADFHSSYMGLIHKYSAKYSVNPLILINEISNISKVDVDEAKLEEIAIRLEKEEELFTSGYQFDKYIGDEQRKK